MPWLIVLAVIASAANNLRNPDQQTMRCRGSVVSVGDPSFELVEKCGKPVFRETIEVVGDQTSLGAYDEGLGVVIEENRRRVIQKWYYRLGRGRFARAVEVSGGQVLRIEILNRQ